MRNKCIIKLGEKNMSSVKKKVYILFVITCLGIGILFPFLKHEYKEYEEEKMINEPEVEEDLFLISLRNEKYYVENNLERYLKYSENKSISTSKIISDVNANLDKEMYKDIEKTDISDEYLMLVNKYYYLTEDYEPNDLVTLDSAYNMGLNNKMRKEAAEKFMEMSNAALLDNITIKNASGYRSYQYQANLYTNYVKRDGVEAADKYSARPGHSEHQTGLTTDINIINDSFEKTPAFRWLQENAYKYGFILRFPKDKEYMTGYKYEPWHYRYVGVNVALQMYDEDLTLEEYYAYYVQNVFK